MTAKVRVLVTDDDDNVRYVTASAMRLAGYDVDEQATGLLALRALLDEAISYDLVVLDIMLPDLDGFEICRRMRHNGVTVPVIFLTARQQPDDLMRGLTIGDDYLTKPFSVEELVARAGALLRRTGRTLEAPPLRAGSIELDAVAHVVRLEGEEVQLSPTEFKLLHFLMSNEGRALARPRIIDQVWGYSFVGEPTVVETYISALRRKLDPGAAMIKTVRGHGYRFVA
jgi:two-component system OmpR family response regulator